YFDYKRNQQSKYWMYETINEQLKNGFYQHPVIQQLIEETEKRVLTNEISSFTGAKVLLNEYTTLSSR
ncbi:MAG: methylmalonyl Co-A mutase-associated GTPase MeaB, partial [Paludibacter sp.]|nr:methylmalonyl Co-A mutase-associated GTPase MeaB [Paludibacter sp.]